MNAKPFIPSKLFRNYVFNDVYYHCIFESIETADAQICSEENKNRKKCDKMKTKRKQKKIETKSYLKTKARLCCCNKIWFIYGNNLFS